MSDNSRNNRDGVSPLLDKARTFIKTLGNSVGETGDKLGNLVGSGVKTPGTPNLPLGARDPTSYGFKAANVNDVTIYVTDESTDSFLYEDVVACNEAEVCYKGAETPVNGMFEPPKPVKVEIGGGKKASRHISTADVIGSKDSLPAKSSTVSTIHEEYEMQEETPQVFVSIASDSREETTQVPVEEYIGDDPAINVIEDVLDIMDVPSGNDTAVVTEGSEPEGFDGPVSVSGGIVVETQSKNLDGTVIDVMPRVPQKKVSEEGEPSEPLAIAEAEAPVVDQALPDEVADSKSDSDAVHSGGMVAEARDAESETVSDGGVPADVPVSETTSEEVHMVSETQESPIGETPTISKDQDAAESRESGSDVEIPPEVAPEMPKIDVRDAPGSEESFIAPSSGDTKVEFDQGGIVEEAKAESTRIDETVIVNPGIPASISIDMHMEGEAKVNLAVTSDDEFKTVESEPVLTNGVEAAIPAQFDVEAASPVKPVPRFNPQELGLPAINNGGSSRPRSRSVSSDPVVKTPVKRVSGGSANALRRSSAVSAKKAMEKKSVDASSARPVRDRAPAFREVSASPAVRSPSRPAVRSAARPNVSQEEIEKAREKMNKLVNPAKTRPSTRVESQPVERLRIRADPSRSKPVVKQGVAPEPEAPVAPVVETIPEMEPVQVQDSVVEVHQSSVTFSFGEAPVKNGSAVNFLF